MPEPTADTLESTLEMPSLPTMAESITSAVPSTLTAIDAEELDEFGPRLSLKDVRQLRALKGFIASGRVTVACKAAGVAHGTWYRWVNDDPEFVRALEHAKDMLADDLEGIAHERARESSDMLLVTLLKAAKPEKYRDKQTITIVSPDVQSRLSRQADAILEVCRMEIADSDLRARVATALANRLREVWS